MRAKAATPGVTDGLIVPEPPPTLDGLEPRAILAAPDDPAPSVASLSQIIDCIGDPIFVKDARHRLVLVNDAECALAGRRREELLGRTDYDILPAEQRQVFWRQDDHVIETGEEIVSEDELPDALGRPRTLITRKTRLIDSAGHRFVVGVIRDITARKQAERALQAAKEYAESLLATANAMVIGLDSEGAIRVFNQAAEKVTGYTHAELAGRDWFEVIVPRERFPQVWEEFARLTAGGEAGEFENPILTKSGEERYVAWRNSALCDRGRFVGTISFGIDITERRRAEERLASLAAAVEQAADDIIVTDLQGRVRYANSAFERTTGYSLAEAVGRNVAELLGGGQRDAILRECQEALAAGRSWQGRLFAPTRSGRLIVQDANVTTIRDPAGRAVGYAYAGRDVTRQVEMERRAAQAEKLEAIGTLAGGIAHDFNNILCAIVGYAQMAQTKCDADSPIRRDLKAILDGSRRASDLIKQILAFSRQEKREEKPVPVAPIVEEALQLLRASIPTTVEIRRALASDAVVLADPTEIHRIVVNLGTNASLAMGERGGVLEVGLRDERLDEAAAAQRDGVAPGRYARLTVGDTGCGMSRELIGRIFEPFFTTRECGQGTGLGLATVHGIVKRCRGAISVESEPGRGTRFDIFLPALEQGAAPAPAPTEALPRGTERVLVVDDDPLVAEALAGMLVALGYDVRVRANGAEALAAVEADPDAVDLVVTDLTMPGLTGDLLAQRLKRLRPGLPVILCTGYSEAAPGDRARSGAVDACLLKPIVIADLSRRAREVLER